MTDLHLALVGISAAALPSCLRAYLQYRLAATALEGASPSQRAAILRGLGFLFERWSGDHRLRQRRATVPDAVSAEPPGSRDARARGRGRVPVRP